MIEQLDVCVHNKKVGKLIQEGKCFVFQYNMDLTDDDFISLTMGVRAKNYQSDELFPIFEMPLPEGYLEATIKKQFAKFTSTGPMGMLQLLAPSIKGRLSYGVTTEEKQTPVSLNDLLEQGSPALFEELVQRFALYSPLSGIQPKVLAETADKSTLVLEDYIVKSWGADYPELALNEYYCMSAVKCAGIAVPEFYLSSDESLFILKRFDIGSDDDYLGFEDFCVLQAKQRDDKYMGSYEAAAKTIKTFVSRGHRHQALRQFFKMTVMNYFLQNGDAHLKNLAVLYTGIENVYLAPAYDVVSTTQYIKNDIPALNVLGSKKWWAKKFLLRFGQEACELSHLQASSLMDECVDALLQLAETLRLRLNHEPNAQKKNVVRHLLTLCEAVD